MSKIETAGKVPSGKGHVPPARQMEPGDVELSEEDRSKDEFFARIADLADAMVARHGKDFTIGALLLAAKFIAEGKPLIKRAAAGGESASVVKSV